MEKKIYQKPEIVLHTLASEASLLEETRVRTESNGPDMWIRAGGTQEQLTNQGWTFAKQSIWDDEEIAYQEEEADDLW